MSEINCSIDIKDIQAQLPGLSCVYTPSIASTQEAVEPNSLLIADHQSAGVGRRGNQWLTPKGRSICLSHRFNMPLPLQQLSGYQMLVAVAITNSIKCFEPCADVQLKWPNDLYHQGRKFAGILINLKQKKQVTEVVVGVGINWQLTKEQLQKVNQPVCNVPLNHLPTRTAFISQFMVQLAAQNDDFINHGLSNCLSQWHEHDYLNGQTIQISRSKATESGQYAGISKQGELMVQTNQGIKHFSSGEVSVKAV